MKVRLLRVDAAPDVFAPLVEAMAARGLRCGWLDLAEAAPAPAGLEAAAAIGMMRAVSAVGARTVAVKPVKGGFVLRDLLREHFRGCALVLVRGEVEAEGLRPDEGSWIVDSPEGEKKQLSTAELADSLRKPKWTSP